MSPLRDRVTLTLTPLDIARIQLNQAIRLFLDERDYLSSTTLAGAADDILGALLKSRGLPHALDQIVEDTIAISAFDNPPEVIDPKGVRYLANYYRNRFKHLVEDAEVVVSVDYEAAAMIQRAADNYFDLLGQETDEMRRFKEFEYFGPALEKA